jgi:hypothetical protein
MRLRLSLVPALTLALVALVSAGCSGGPGAVTTPTATTEATGTPVVSPFQCPAPCQADISWDGTQVSVLGQAAIASLRIKSKQEFEAIGGADLQGAHYGQFKHLALNDQDVECSAPTPAPDATATPTPSPTTPQPSGPCVNLVFLVHTNPSSAATDTDKDRKGYYAKVQVLTAPNGGTVQIRFDTYTADGSKSFAGQAMLLGNSLPLGPGHVTVGLIANTDLSFVNGQTTPATPTPTPTTTP